MGIRISWSTVETTRLPEGGDQREVELTYIDLDVLASESYEAASELTEHPVDEGAPIADHKRRQPKRYTLEVIQSATPMSTAVEGAEYTDIELASGGGATMITLPDGTDRVADAFNAIQRLAEEDLEVTITGLRADVDRWVVTRFATIREVGTAGALVATLEVSEVRRAQTREVDAPSPRVERGRRRRDRGAVGSGTDVTNPAAPTTSSSPSNRQSALSALRESLSGGSGNTVGAGAGG